MESLGVHQFAIHPTALISACDFHARIQAERNLNLLESGDRLIGLVIGRPAADPTEPVQIVDCCEVKHTSTPFKLDEEFVCTRRRMLKKVDPTSDIVGWFCFGKALPADHKNIQEEFVRASATFAHDVTANLRFGSVAVVFHDIDVHSVDALPVSVFAMAAESPRSLSAEVAFDAAEEIAMLAISKLEPPTRPGGSKLKRQYLAMKTALQKLNSRISVMQSYLKAVKRGETPMNHSLVRRINGVLAQLPLVAPERDLAKMENNRNDAVLFTYLSDVLKSVDSLNSIVIKTASTRNRSGRSAVYDGPDSAFGGRKLHRGL